MIAPQDILPSPKSWVEWRRPPTIQADCVVVFIPCRAVATGEEDVLSVNIMVSWLEARHARFPEIIVEAKVKNAALSVMHALASYGYEVDYSEPGAKT
jgi:hypothetical protein